ncbi:MAG: hypothetical protein HY327_01460 [Chloroflexi bacterium]|nr:hypothetical protein [Chloroflexota bacterium]
MARSSSVAQSNLTVGELVAKAKRLSKPIEMREAEMVVVVMPQRDYEQFQALRRAQVPIVKRPRKTFKRALGLLASSQTAPSNAQIQAWLEEHRMEKYG